MNAQSPHFNFEYRKLIYFFKDEENFKPKSAIIMPILTDNKIMLNSREGKHFTFIDTHSRATPARDLRISYLEP